MKTTATQTKTVTVEEFLAHAKCRQGVMMLDGVKWTAARVKAYRNVTEGEAPNTRVVSRIHVVRLTRVSGCVGDVKHDHRDVSPRTLVDVPVA